jgi:hypothetical protein
VFHKLDHSRFLAAAFVGLILGTSSPCRGDLIMFEGFGPSAFFGDNIPANGLEVAASDCFAFTSGNDHFHIGDMLPGQPFNGTGILLEDQNSAITMTRVGGGMFDLLSADLAQDNSNADQATGVIVMGFFGGGGSISKIVAIPATPNSGFRHPSFVGYTNLLSVTFQGTGSPSASLSSNGFTLDNIGVNTGTVPEPASLTMLGMGFLSILVYARRRGPTRCHPSERLVPRAQGPLALDGLISLPRKPLPSPSPSIRRAPATAIENPSTSAGRPPSPPPGDHSLHARRKDTMHHPGEPRANRPRRRAKRARLPFRSGSGDRVQAGAPSMPGRSGRGTATQGPAQKVLAAAMRGAGALARLAFGAILLLSSVAVLLGIAGRGWPRGQATPAGVPMRIDSVDVGPSLGPDRFLDPESGLPVVAVLPGRGNLICASWSPWRDERGQAQLVGLVYGASPNRPGDYALVRLSQPDGAVLGRISHEDLPGWVAPPCWFPDRSERLLLAGGDGQLYRLDFGSDDARGPWPRPLPWRAGGDPLRIARFGDLSWPGDPQLGPRLVLASLYTRAEGRRGPEERSIWWLRLDRGAESIVAARRLVPRGEPDSSPGEDERFPVLSPGAGPPVLAWLERARGRPGDAWRLRAAPIEVDADSGDPFVMVRGARTLATDCACVAPAFGADGGSIAYVAAGSERSPTIRRLPLAIPPAFPATASAPEKAPEG